MKVVIGSDHAAIELRSAVKDHLESKGFEVLDCGTFNEKANYVTEGLRVAENIALGNGDFGIVMCGSGIGISMAANKVRGIRCALLAKKEMAPLAKEHNNANVIALGGRINTIEENLEIIDAYLAAEFEGGRHQTRILSLEDYEEGCLC